MTLLKTAMRDLMLCSHIKKSCNAVCDAALVSFCMIVVKSYFAAGAGAGAGVCAAGAGAGVL